MGTLTLDYWISIAQIVVAIVTAIGVIASLYMSVRALKEVQTDRAHRQKPYLAFESGGWKFPLKFEKAGRRIPGVDPGVVESAFAKLPPDADSVRVDEPNAEGETRLIPIGRLKNYGLGPALEVRVTWIPSKIRIGDESIEIEEEKRTEPPYKPSFNRMPSLPRHIFPEGVGGLSRLPTFIEKDFEKKIDEAEGVLEISCQDVFGQTHVTKQGFWMETNYKQDDDGPYLHISFQELIETSTRSV